MKVDAVKFHIGERVYFAADTEKSGIVTAVCFRSQGISYGVSWEDYAERWHGELELAREKSFAKGGEAP